MYTIEERHIICRRESRLNCTNEGITIGMYAKSHSPLYSLDLSYFNYPLLRSWHSPAYTGSLHWINIYPGYAHFELRKYHILVSQKLRNNTGRRKNVTLLRDYPSIPYLHEFSSLSMSTCTKGKDPLIHDQQSRIISINHHSTWKEINHYVN